MRGRTELSAKYVLTQPIFRSHLICRMEKLVALLQIKGNLIRLFKVENYLQSGHSPSRGTQQ